ncbi:MAG: heavy metal translocating P-type ATPase, partial [Pedobacter sp.]
MKDCCSTDDNTTEHTHTTETVDHGGHDHGHADVQAWRQHLGLLIALFILIVLSVLDYGFNYEFNNWVSLGVNGIAYLLAGWPVLGLAIRKLKRGDIFNEFVLMSVATLGAFYIGEYIEGVAVMVF